MSPFSRFESLLVVTVLTSSLVVASIGQDCIPEGDMEFQGCAKPLTGCICVWDSAFLTIGSYGDCEGCYYSFSGSLTCDGGQTVTPVVCSGNLGFESRIACGSTCPCTHQPYYPVRVDCGPCQ